MQRTTKTVKIDGTGRITFIWADELLPVFALGKGSIKRASHVEPTPQGRWTADLGPVGGPVLGPFASRGEALAEEVRWLNANVIGGGEGGN